MFKHVITRNINSKKVAWNNLKEVVKTDNMNLIISAIEGWFKENRGKKNTDLEKKLREEKINLYLLVNKTIPSEYLTVSNFTEKFKPCLYMLEYICNTNKYTQNKIKEYADNYEENFKNLDQAGTLYRKDQLKIKKIKFKNKPYEQQNLFEKLQNNEIIIKIKIIERSKYQDILTKDLENFNKKYRVFNKKYKKYAKKEQPKIISFAPDGSPIFGLFFENNLISKIGIMIGYNKRKKQIISYVSLEDREQWIGFSKK